MEHVDANPIELDVTELWEIEQYETKELRKCTKKLSYSAPPRQNELIDMFGESDFLMKLR